MQKCQIKFNLRQDDILQIILKQLYKLMLLSKIFKQSFCTIKAEPAPLTQPQIITIKNIITTTLRNLYFLQTNLQIVFSTSTILNSDPLRSLRKINTTHIDQTLKKVLLYRVPPPLAGYLDAQSLAFRNALFMECSKRYQIGRTIRKIEDNIDQRLREMNVQDIEEKQLRRFLIGIREDYHPFSQELLAQQKPKIYNLADNSIFTGFINSILKKTQTK